MKRSMAGLFATALLSTGLTLPASPADAHTDSCAGSGIMQSNPVYHMGFGPSATGAVVFTFTVGGCVIGSGTVFSATFSANPVGNYCEYSTGTAGIGPDSLDWTNVGYVWTFSGSHGGGVLVVVPNSAAGQSCMTGATEFLFTGLISMV